MLLVLKLNKIFMEPLQTTTDLPVGYKIHKLLRREEYWKYVLI